MIGFGMLQIILGLSGFALWICYRRKTIRHKLPPGPKPLPIVGNLRDLPSGKTPEYQHWLKFKDNYGLISRVSILGQSLIILHDRHATHELLEKRSSKTSGRPYMHFASKLCGYGIFLNFQQYDSTFRKHRKLVHQQLGTPAAVARFRDIQDVESRRFLFRILEDPGNVINHIKTEASAIILRMTYGYSVEPHKPDPLTVLILRMMHGMSLAFNPLAWLVDIFPILEHFPEFLPGMSFKKIAREWNEITRMVINAPYTFVREEMRKGNYRPSYVSSLIDEFGAHDGTGVHHDGEIAIKRTAAIMYAGGSDTTVSSITSLVLAMILFPEVQRKAQEEIDINIGVDGLPHLGDRDNLPYVNALVKEAIRWLPVTPMGVAHRADEDMSYGGFHIPKGSYLLPAVWWFLHDPNIYSHPSSFDPDRFLEPRNEPDPTSEAFGYGRRICPGRFLADESLFITISRLLAAFRIKKAVDEQGNEINPNIGISPGVVCRPLDFRCEIKPRTLKHEDLIRSIVVERPWEDSDATLLPKEVALYAY